MASVLPFPAHQSRPFEVFNSDPANPPKPPPGSRFIEIRDASGEVIGGSWISPIFDGEAFEARSWSYARFLESIVCRPAREA